LKITLTINFVGGYRHNILDTMSETATAQGTALGTNWLIGRVKYIVSDARNIIKESLQHCKAKEAFHA